METLKKEQGADWVRVPFHGGGEAVNAILSGSTPIALFGEGNVIGQIRAGKMTPLVMINNIRSPNFPDVPLLKEIGYNGPAVAQLVRDVRARRHARSRSSTSSPRRSPPSSPIRPSAARHLTARSLVPAINTPEQFAEEIKRDRVVAKQVVKDAGFEPQ